MKRICFLVALLVLPLIGVAQKEMLLINQPQGDNATVKKLLSSLLTEAALNSAEYQPISNEDRLKNAMMSRGDTSVRIGKVAPCKYGLFSEIKGASGMLLVTVRVLNLETASVEKIDRVIIEEDSDMSTLKQELSDFATSFFPQKRKK